MQRAAALMEVIHERGKKGIPLERLYRHLFNPELYLRAYGKIYRNDGSMTPGVNEETVDGMSLKKIQAIIDALRNERYRWAPARRVYIDKKGAPGKRRPLGLPSWSGRRQSPWCGWLAAFQLVSSSVIGYLVSRA
jgi:hypothetical protein